MNLDLHQRGVCTTVKAAASDLPQRLSHTQQLVLPVSTCRLPKPYT